jgi:hypothetical protein
MIIDRALAVLGLLVGVVALALGILALYLQIGSLPVYTMNDRHCLSYGRPRAGLLRCDQGLMRATRDRTVG